MRSKSIADFLRLYMIPGMQHCGGGSGPTDFNFVEPLGRWVEKGKAPDSIPGRYEQQTRPLCGYPLVARYKGKGDADEAANFTCTRE